MCSHQWTKWKVKTRQMRLVGGLFVKKEEHNREFTEEFQERRCEKCGKTQRERVGP